MATSLMDRSANIFVWTSRNRHAFNVNGKYRLRKNTASLRLLTAVLCARAVTIGFYLVSSFVVREILDYSDQTTWRATVESLYVS